jgi:hypothetical protein
VDHVMSYHPTEGAITRRLSPSSFETDDPAGCVAWLQAIGGRLQPVRGPLEQGRVSIGGGGVIVYRSGLIIAISPAQRTKWEDRHDDR